MVGNIPFLNGQCFSDLIWKTVEALKESYADQMM